MSHEHHHHRQTSRHVLTIALILTATFMLVEVGVGFLTHSLALLSDAGHMLTDAAALGMSLLAFWFSSKPETPDKTYGMHRIEVLAATANGVLLLLLCSFIIIEAVQRMGTPVVVNSGPMMLVALMGLLLNIFVAWLLFGQAKDNLNVMGAFLHVIGDTLGSVGALVAGLIMYFTQWYLADVIVSIFIASIIIYSATQLILESTHILMEGTPKRISTDEVRQTILAIEGVHNLHDLHIWSVTSGYHALSAHLIIDDLSRGCDYIAKIRHTVRDKWQIEHITIQIENEDFHQEEEMLHL